MKFSTFITYDFSNWIFGISFGRSKDLYWACSFHFLCFEWVLMFRRYSATSLNNP